MPAGSEKNEQSSLLGKWLNRAKKSDEPKGVRPRPDGVRVPLSAGQQPLLFLQQLYPENPFYHYAETYRIKGTPDVGSLIRSFEIAARRHDVLRTKIVFENGQPFQLVNDEPLFDISEHDLRSLERTDAERAARKLALEAARKPLETPDGYVTRISVFRLSDDEYTLVLTLHHILTDKWSMRLLQNEVAEYYRRLTGGEDVEYSPLEIQYADYAYWQSLQKPHAENLSYWKNRLQDSLTFLDLPGDFPRPKRPTFRGALSTQIFPVELSRKLKNFSRERRKTLYAVILAAFKILLQRYSGETDILVGSPFTNRDELALENLIGFFDDTLVLRSDLSNDPTFIELLEQVWATTQAAFAHKNMPFEKLVKSLNIERYLNYNPLFQVMFIYQDPPEKSDWGKNLTIEHEPFDLGATKFDLTLFIVENEDEISAIFEYSKDLFEQETIERMHGHLRRLLEGIVENPHRPISKLPVVTDPELKLFSAWNDTNFDDKRPTSIIESFSEQVRSSPRQTAVSFQNDRVNYEELNRRANSVANYLLKLNPDQQKPIGLLAEPSIEMIVGILGILKAGLAYLPLDAEYPKSRLDYILEDSSASVVLAQKHLSPTVAETSLTVGTIEEIVASESADEPPLPSSIKADDTAYVIYTSGSTGRPKGVCVTHGNLVYSTAARFDYYPHQPGSFLLMSSFSFDSSVAGIFWTLAAGGKLVLVERRAEQDLNRLAGIFVGEEITHTLLLPTLYSALMKNLPKKAFETFKTIIVAGEACPKSLCQEHFDFLPEVELYNEYGPTEATVWATVHKTTHAETGISVPIGKPISGAQIYILDEHQNRVPIGVPGELYIGGKGVAKGYFNNPELTNKRFVENAFDPESSDKIYRTGDLARFRADGTIEFLGRRDDQVKVRGYRVELGEIEAAIKQNARVREVVIRLESTQKNAARRAAGTVETLLEDLEKMSFEEADELLKSVEKLSAGEIEFMLGEAAHF